MVDVFSLAIQLHVLCNQCVILSLIFVEFDAKVSEIKLNFFIILFLVETKLCAMVSGLMGAIFYILFSSITAPQVERKR